MYSLSLGASFFGSFYLQVSQPAKRFNFYGIHQDIIRFKTIYSIAWMYFYDQMGISLRSKGHDPIHFPGGFGPDPHSSLPPQFSMAGIATYTWK